MASSVSASTMTSRWKEVAHTQARLNDRRRHPAEQIKELHMSRTFGLLLSLFVYTGCPPIVLNETDDMNSTMADMASQEFDVLANLRCTSSAPSFGGGLGVPVSLDKSSAGIKLSTGTGVSLCAANSPPPPLLPTRTVRGVYAELPCDIPPDLLSKFTDTSTYDVLIEQKASLPANMTTNGIAAAGASISLSMNDGVKDVFVFRPNPSQRISVGGVITINMGESVTSTSQTPAIKLSGLKLSVKFEAYIMCDTDAGAVFSSNTVEWNVTKLTLKSRPR